jgi:hypothetical protein
MKILMSVLFVMAVMLVIPELAFAGPAAVASPWFIPLIAASVATAAAGTAYQIKSGEDAKDDAKKQRDEQQAQARKLQSEFASRQAGEEGTAAADSARRQARRRQLALSTAGQSRQDTILTQGLGSTGAQASQQKTLLGA